MIGKRTILLAMMAVFMLVSCGGSSGGGDPAKTVESYLQAKVKGDKDTLRGLLCSDMEKDLDREASAFSTVSEASIQDMLCKLDGAVVRCDGKIVAQYGTEQTEFPLTSYKVVQEDGEWKWCGEAG
jgi:hypothetical protein